MVGNETMKFKVSKDNEIEAREILSMVFEALNEKGYNSINQLVGYILSGDPTYITNHKNARSVIRRLERDELLEEVIKFYMKQNNYMKPKNLDV
ncbi:MAG: IreB family regulatory phosphoprotein [Oscillospiraceae bacterium]|nr:IreB family regulatory phosphoprotein [Oscillospiraceae bacterium]